MHPGSRPLQRVGIEARSVAVLARVGAPLLRTTAPHRYLAALPGGARHGALGAGVAVLAAMHRDRPAIVDEQGTTTYADLERRTTRIAAGLEARGVGPGTTVGLLCRNHAAMVEGLVAAAKLGTTLVLLNTEFSGPQLRDVCAREGVDLLVHDAGFDDVVGDLAATLRLGTVLALAGPQDDGRPTLARLAASPARTRLRRPAAPRLVLLTSGTTGTPKGAPRGLDDAAPSLAPIAGMLAAIPYSPRSTVLVAPPLFHAWGLANLAIALGLGSTVVLAPTAAAAQQWDLLRRHRVDTLVTVPTLLARLVQHVRGGDPGDPVPLRVVASSGSALPTALAREVDDLFGPVLHNLYGSTEAGYVAIAGPADLRERPGTVGRPPLGVRVALLDADGRPVPEGGPGRIFADTGVGFGGYTGGGTKEVVDGLMATGDVGRLDRDGYLFVEGRDDDMIVSGGENVFPAEVDDCLLALPGVLDAVCVGVPDEAFGQRLAAFVVRADDALTADDVRAHVRAQLARYKVPRDVTFVDELPRNPAGKVVRSRLPLPADGA